MDIRTEIEAENKSKLINKLNEKCKSLTSQPHCNANVLCDWNGIKNTCDVTRDCTNLSNNICNLQINKCLWEDNSCIVNYK